MTLVAVDTSVAVPLLHRAHHEHRGVATWADGRTLALCGDALAETYSVLTRLPGDAALLPHDAAHAVAERFDPPVTLPAREAAHLAKTFAQAEIAGGAVYDGLVALAARAAGLPLATRDERARETYRRLEVDVVVVAA